MKEVKNEKNFIIKNILLFNFFFQMKKLKKNKNSFDEHKSLIFVLNKEIFLTLACTFSESLKTNLKTFPQSSALHFNLQSIPHFSFEITPQLVAYETKKFT